MKASRNLAGVTLALVAAMTLSSLGKSARTYYDPARMERLRRNLERHDWARAQRDRALAEAERWAARDDAFLRAMVIPPTVPRCYDIHQNGCPVHGTAANRNGLYTWGYSLDRPFRIVCPAGGEEYPSNDFAAFLASGGRDRSLLTGDYPDDGWGWQKPGEAHATWFVAYYAHWSMQREVRGALEALSQGALLSDDPARARVFAHKAALLLWQLAVYYPDYDYATQARESKEHNPSYTGRITNMIWEVGWADTCAVAYDAVWPHLADDLELQRQAGLDAAGLDRFVRDRLLMTMARDITSGNGRNRGNFGAHQRALIRLALALDEDTEAPTSAAMIAWVLANPKPVVDSDMGLVDALENLVYRDGFPPESPGYNMIWTQGIAEVAGVLGEQASALRAHPRLRRMLLWPHELRMAGRFQPPLGDSGDIFAGVSMLSPSTLMTALRWNPDPRLAEDLRGRGGAGSGDLFGESADEVLAGIPAASPPPASSRLLPGYGLAILEATPAASPMAAALHFGSWTHHSHRDQLNLLLFAHDNALLSDVGYPEQTDAFNHRRYGIWSNTVAHNTVVVDARGQGRGRGVLHAFEPNGFAQVADASCQSYPQVSLYRRAVMMVDTGQDERFVFDVFHVRGGRQHDWALVGPPASFACEPPLGPAQEEGTLAGVEVPYEQFYDDPALKDKPLGMVPCTGYQGSGFQFFVKVRRAPLAGQAVADWRLTEPRPGQPKRPWEGIGLRTHLVGTDEEVLAADCQPQRYERMPPWLTHLFRRRCGEDLRSAFVAVHEPYAGGQPWIEGVRSLAVTPADGEAVAVEVRLRRGGRVVCFHSLQPGRSYEVEGGLRVDGQAACVAFNQAGAPERAMLLNGRGLAGTGLQLDGQGARKSPIRRVDYERGIVELNEPILGAELRPGQVVILRGPSHCEAVTLREVLDPTRFSIGDEDLVVGGGTVNGVVPEAGRLITSAVLRHAEPGMAVLNARGEFQGRLAAGEAVTLDRDGLPPLAVSSFPDAASGLGPRFSVVIAAPGDTVTLPSLTLWPEAPARP
ncbi:MAG: hypothetical protein GX595_00040 [Lentisphaerae bacterium]|nr:hypothetical protein [Lentisphaerota bacterium]